MKKFTLADWGHIAEIFGAVAVVVSLVYVGKQLQQNTEAIQTQTSQQVMATYTDAQVAILGESPLAPLMVKAESGQETTAEEDYRLNVWAHLVIGNWEQSYRNHRDGLLQEEVWQAWDRFFRSNMEIEYFRDAWVNNPIDGYTVSFTRYVNEEVLGGNPQ
jgi:hypothetical protein